MNQNSGAEALVQMLKLHSVDTVFGLCGDTMLPFYDALYRTGDGIRHILTRDERHATYMADGCARVRGKVGVCEGPSGGGATYILPGVVEANEFSIPILVIMTDILVAGRGKYTLPELDQNSLYGPLTKWNQVIDTSTSLPQLVRTASAEMTTGKPGAAHLGLPFNVQDQPVDGDNICAQEDLGRYPARHASPAPEAIEAAAEVLLSASRPVIICGGGVVIAGAKTELTSLAKVLDAPVATTVSGQGAISDRPLLGLGEVGSNGNNVSVPETRTIIEDANLVMFVTCRAGSVTTERCRYPAPGTAKIVQIDAAPRVISANYEPDAAVLGDAQPVLAALVGAVAKRQSKRSSSDAAARVAAARKAKFDAFNKLAQANARPIKPERIVATMQDVLPGNAAVVCDSGTPCPHFSAFYDQVVTGRNIISNRAHGALGFALSAAVGAHACRPDAPVVSVMGNGSFGMCVGELETIVRLNLPITLVVISNGVFGWIKAGQESGYEERYYSVDFKQSDHARIAEAYGVKSWRIEDPAELVGELREAVETPGAALIDNISQPLQEARGPVCEWVA